MTIPETRKPIRFATYPGNVASIVGEVKGPNLLGEYLTAVTASGDLATDQGGLPDISAMRARGWFIAPKHGDLCPDCYATTLYDVVLANHTTPKETDR